MAEMPVLTAEPVSSISPAASRKAPVPPVTTYDSLIVRRCPPPGRLTLVSNPDHVPSSVAPSSNVQVNTPSVIAAGKGVLRQAVMSGRKSPKFEVPVAMPIVLLTNNVGTGLHGPLRVAAGRLSYRVPEIDTVAA